MNSDTSKQATPPDERVSSLVNEYFDRRRAGEDLSPDRFVAEHPEMADELRPYCEGLALVEDARTMASATDAGACSTRVTELPPIAGYELIEQLGRGGMGVVYKALQVSTKRVVALKVMLAGPFASESARRRFEREVELAARLQHPAIVHVLESSEVAGQRYFAMDYVAGARLDRYLSTTQPDLRTTLNLLVEVCDAVDYAHQHGVVHRDLKPANILIDDEGKPHILDFGLAKATDQADSEEAVSTCVSLPGQVLGTLFYLSPEQAAGAPDQIDARTDVYALGVMLFEALTGALPFDTAGRPSQIIQRILESAPFTPSSLSDRVDGELETIILKALEKDQTRRYQSARELADDLRRYLGGEPILARRPSSLYVLRKKLVKHRLATAFAAVIIVAGLLSIPAALWWQQRERDAARHAALATQARLEGGDRARAVGPTEMLYRQHPDLTEVCLVMAQALHRNEARDRAVHLLEQRLQRDPSQWPFRALLAEFYETAGDAERARTLQTEVERSAPDTAEAWYLRSFATLELTIARDCAERAAERAPLHTLAWRRLTDLRLKTDDPDGAARAADKLIELGDDPVNWVLYKGHILARQGRFRRAIEQYSRAATLRPNDAAPYSYRAHAYRRIQEFAKAVEDYTKAIELHGEPTSNVWYAYQRATPLWILGRTDEALEDYRRFRILLGRPWHGDARRYLILRELGRVDEAEQVLSDARRDLTDDYPWLRHIFRCLAGELAPDELITAAGGDREQICEAYYYAGEVQRLLNQPAEARGCFELCVQTGVQFDLDVFPLTPMNEYELAQWRLASLSVGDAPGSQSANP